MNYSVVIDFLPIWQLQQTDSYLSLLSVLFILTYVKRRANVDQCQFADKGYKKHC